MGHDDHYTYLKRELNMKEINKKLSKIGRVNIFKRIVNWIFPNK